MATRTKTKTKTTTTTWTRINLLTMQVRIALRRTTDINETTLEKVFERGLHEKLIGRVYIYGVDDQEYCHAQITIEIDWKKHKLHVQEGRGEVIINSRWKEGISLEIGEVTKGFNEYASAKNLRTFWRVSYVPGVDNSEADEILGLHTADPVKWNVKTEGLSVCNEELDEMIVKFEYVS